MHSGDRAQVHRVQGDAMELQAVMQGGHIGELTAQPVQGFADDYLEPAGLQVRQELAVTVPEGAVAADGPVLIDLGKRPALLLDVATANLDLVLDGGVALVVGGIAGINDGAQVSSPWLGFSPR